MFLIKLSFKDHLLWEQISTGTKWFSFVFNLTEYQHKYNSIKQVLSVYRNPISKHAIYTCYERGDNSCLASQM